MAESLAGRHADAAHATPKADHAPPGGAPKYDPTQDPNLGALSEHYEAGTRGSDAIGHDSTGGWSYGKYQIATRTGTMKSFLNYAKHHDPDVYQALEEAGGAKGAAAHSPEFVKAWHKAAADGSLQPLEHGFVRDTHFTPQREKLAEAGLDLSKRDRALNDAVWSTAVQHGRDTHVVTNALGHLVKAEEAKDAKTGAHRTHQQIVDGIDDKHLIEAIYEERGATTTVGHKTVMKYFHGSSQQVQDSVAHRFKSESAQAVSMIGHRGELMAEATAGHHAAGTHHAGGASHVAEHQHHHVGEHHHAQAHGARPPEEVLTGKVLTRHSLGGGGEDPFAAYVPPPAIELHATALPPLSVPDPALAPARPSDSVRDWSAMASQVGPAGSENPGGAAAPDERRQASAAYWQSRASSAAGTQARESGADQRDATPAMER
jgi:hypothetical protein